MCDALLLNSRRQRYDQALTNGYRIAIGNAIGFGDVLSEAVVFQRDPKQVFTTLNDVHGKCFIAGLLRGMRRRQEYEQCQ